MYKKPHWNWCTHPGCEMAIASPEVLVHLPDDSHVTAREAED